MDVGATRKMEGVAHCASGKFTSDGAIANINLGFRPRHVIVINLTTATRLEKIDGMTDAQTLQTAAVATTPPSSQSTIATGGLIIITQSGFSIADAALALNDVVSFTATN